MTRIRIAVALAASALVACGSSDKKDGPIDPPPSSTFKVHYHRADATYTGWTVEVTAGSAATTVTSTETDGWGAVYTFDLSSGATALTFSLKNGGTTDPGGVHTVDVSGSTRVAYVTQGSDIVVPRVPPVLPGANQAVLYYVRADKLYSGWGVHVWGDQGVNTQWSTPIQQTGSADETLGAGFVIDLARNSPNGSCPAGRICFIVHKGDTKDPGPDITDWDPAVYGNIIFTASGSPVVSAKPRKVGVVELTGASAHLVSPSILLWNVTDAAATAFELRTSATAAVKVNDAGVSGGTAVTLTPRTAAVPQAILDAAPHLAAYRAFDVAWTGAADAAATAALKGQLVAVAKKADGSMFAATKVQAPFAIDALFANTTPLGVTWAAGAPTLALWAPTAQEVTLKIYSAAKAEEESHPLTMDAKGVWSYTGAAALKGKFYRYVVKVYHWETDAIETVTVTDPYSVSLSTDSLYSQIVDLADAALKPAGWDAVTKPALEAPEDIVVYETHIRDFSASDATAPAAARGKYLGFVTPSGQAQSDGLEYLATLAAAGLTHVHLLPAFDIATVLEDPTARVDVGDTYAKLCTAVAPSNPAETALCDQYKTTALTIWEVFQSLAGDSQSQQVIANHLHLVDGFNWGYDPLHYGVPEGSYASTAEGTARVLEFRQMVKGLADVGLRTVMDVVYNHTNASGLSPKSVLDKVVPGYYHRRDQESGFVATSTCCANTATEHVMMRRLMKDTLVRWAREYKVDGFRFDLMGHHMKSDMLEVKAALAALTPGADGVDGSKIYLYGEGWDFGEVAAQARGVNAVQRAMAGTGIGTFNDRIRDAVRGGGPFDNATDAGVPIRKNQGFSNGLYTDPNDKATADAATKEKLLLAADVIKVSMAGNLRDFILLLRDDTTYPGGTIGYNGAPAGYTQDPQENINYTSAHDNQTLFDILQYKLPTGTPMATRVRSLNLALSTVALAQGIPFFHMGDELLRSKSMERDSYDSGDWFNRVDWTFQKNGWKSGLPNAGKDQANWPLIQTLFADASIAPAPADIAAGKAHFEELLKLRKSSPLFRLRTKAEVMARVDYLNAGSTQVPGVIVQTVTDGTCAGADLDPAREAIVVIVNGDKVAHTMTVTGASGFVLHPLQAASADATVKTATVSGADFTVPARTAAVFVKPQAGAQGAGLPCNTRVSN